MRTETRLVEHWRAVDAELATFDEPAATVGELREAPFDEPFIAAAWIVMERRAEEV